MHDILVYYRGRFLGWWNVSYRDPKKYVCGRYRIGGTMHYFDTPEQCIKFLKDKANGK